MSRYDATVLNCSLFSLYPWNLKRTYSMNYWRLLYFNFFCEFTMSFFYYSLLSFKGYGTTQHIPSALYWSVLIWWKWNTPGRNFEKVIIHDLNVIEKKNLVCNSVGYSITQTDIRLHRTNHFGSPSRFVPCVVNRLRLGLEEGRTLHLTWHGPVVFAY